MSRAERMAALVAELDRHAVRAGRPLNFMEVCGTHTVSACRGGIHSLVPPGVRLLSGPGCPVCVTAQCYIDALIDLGRRDGVILATYGDLVRVTGSGGSLERARSEGAAVQVVHSTLEAVELAAENPDREVVFAGVGFETTAPATAVAVQRAAVLGLSNFTVLCGHKLVLPAMRALLADQDVRIDGFLCPGHVSVIIGAEAYGEIVTDHRRPCVVAGFDPLMIMEGIVALAAQAADGRAELVNLYPSVVKPGGNPAALALLDRMFEPAGGLWRALGTIPQSALELRPAYSRFDAFARFDLELPEEREIPGCRCGEVITGKAEPADCALFGNPCTPTDPVGPCMVSSEGACRAWFRYRRGGRPGAPV
jgi:hydrogenase expression/formation protein HypD